MARAIRAYRTLAVFVAYSCLTFTTIYVTIWLQVTDYQANTEVKERIFVNRLGCLNLPGEFATVGTRID